MGTQSLNAAEGISSGGIYLEAAEPQTTKSAWGCREALFADEAIEPAFPAGARGTAVGTGAQNTRDIVTQCDDPNSAGNLVARATFGTKDDWFLPSERELNELCKFARGMQTGNPAVNCSLTEGREPPQRFKADTPYWSSTQVSPWAVKIREFSGTYTDARTQFTNNETYNTFFSASASFITSTKGEFGLANAIPVRAFSPGPQTVQPNLTWSQLPPASRRTATCGGTTACKLGDIGPGGGTVFYVGTTVINSAPGISGGGKYMEYFNDSHGMMKNMKKWSTCATRPLFVAASTAGTPFSDAIGAGANNTKLLAADSCESTTANNEFTYPAAYAANKNVNDKSDWFLPSLNELEALCKFANGQTADIANEAVQCRRIDFSGKFDFVDLATTAWSSSLNSDVKFPTIRTRPDSGWVKNQANNKLYASAILVRAFS